MATPSTRAPGHGWVRFAAILLMVAGVMQFFDGLWALRTKNTAVDALFWNNNLNAWGWFYLIIGIGLFLTGLYILRGAAWAYGVGIFVGCIGAVLNIFWIFTYPVASILLITLNLMVVYALTTYGMDEM